MGLKVCDASGEVAAFFDRDRQRTDESLVAPHPGDVDAALKKRGDDQEREDGVCPRGDLIAGNRLEADPDARDCCCYNKPEEPLEAADPGRNGGGHKGRVGRVRTERQAGGDAA